MRVPWDLRLLTYRILMIEEADAQPDATENTAAAPPGGNSTEAHVIMM